MQPTLFFIPHQWLGWPLLVAWLLISAIVAAYYWQRGGWSEELKGFLPMVAMVTAAILFVLPAVEVAGVDPDNPLGPMVNRGLAVRGYGLCMLLAIGLTAHLDRKIDHAFESRRTAAPRRRRQSPCRMPK